MSHHDDDDGGGDNDGRDPDRCHDDAVDEDDDDSSDVEDLSTSVSSRPHRAICQTHAVVVLASNSFLSHSASSKYRHPTRIRWLECQARPKPRREQGQGAMSPARFCAGARGKGRLKGFGRYRLFFFFSSFR